VFNRSIAPLQYALAKSVSSIKNNLFREGVDAIRCEAERLRSVLDQELNKIQAQEALDAIDAAGNHDEDAFTAMLEVDDSIADHGEEALNAWVRDRLRFAVWEEGDGIKRYVYDLRRPTLLPLSNTIAQFMACIDDAPQCANHRFQLPLKPFTVDRSKAEKYEIPLLRVGHPFIEALEASVRNDDRGRAFAMWRFVPSGREPALYFRLDFLIEADLTEAADLLETLKLSSASLRRRADDAFPPSYRTIWLSSDLENVEDQTILRTLAMPYARQPRISGGFDRNVRGERWEEALRQLDLADWSDVVFRAKTVGETMLRHGSELLELCREQGRAFDTAVALVASRLESRIHRLSGAARTSEEVWARREASLADAIRRGIAAPRITLDCMGAVILAGSPLEA
jgi:ATP-dependent helicase HepA